LCRALYYAAESGADTLRLLQTLHEVGAAFGLPVDCDPLDPASHAFQEWGLVAALRDAHYRKQRSLHAKRQQAPVWAFLR